MKAAYKQIIAPRAITTIVESERAPLLFRFRRSVGCCLPVNFDIFFVVGGWICFVDDNYL